MTSTDVTSHARPGLGQIIRYVTNGDEPEGRDAITIGYPVELGVDGDDATIHLAVLDPGTPRLDNIAQYVPHDQDGAPGTWQWQPDER